MSAEVVLCTHKTTFSASLDYFVKSSPPYLHQFSTISGGNCINQETLTEEESTSQEIQAITCVPHTLTSMEEPIPSLGQLCFTHSPLQSQPQHYTEGTSKMAPQIGSHGLQENPISHEDRGTCQH